VHGNALHTAQFLLYGHPERQEKISAAKTAI
jgi:hypothetical protein